MITLFGWLALALYLIAHGHLSISKQFNRFRYYQINLVAAVFFIVNSWALSSWQSVWINVFWALISILTLKGVEVRSNRPCRLGIVGSVVALAVAALGVLPWSAPWAIELIGWAGAVLYCVAYFFLADRVISRRQYLWMNVLAAIILLPAYWVDTNLPALWMGVSWTAFSVFGLWRLRQQGVGESRRSIYPGP